MSETGLISAVNRNQDTARAMYTAKSHVAAAKRSPETDLSTEAGISGEGSGHQANLHHSGGDPENYGKHPEKQGGTHLDVTV